MGAPGYTVFCKNGHIVESIPHHCISTEDIEKCQHCGSTELATIMEWGDDDYGPHEVPYEPIGSEWVDIDNDTFKGKARIDIYDVSRVKWQT